MLNLGFLWDIQVEMPWNLLVCRSGAWKGVLQEVKLYMSFRHGRWLDLKYYEDISYLILKSPISQYYTFFRHQETE